MSSQHVQQNVKPIRGAKKQEQKIDARGERLFECTNNEMLCLLQLNDWTNISSGHDASLAAATDGQTSSSFNLNWNTNEGETAIQWTLINMQIILLGQQVSFYKICISIKTCCLQKL